MATSGLSDFLSKIGRKKTNGNIQQTTGQQSGVQSSMRRVGEAQRTGVISPSYNYKDRGLTSPRQREPLLSPPKKTRWQDPMLGTTRANLVETLGRVGAALNPDSPLSRAGLVMSDIARENRLKYENKQETYEKEGKAFAFNRLNRREDLIDEDRKRKNRLIDDQVSSKNARDLAILKSNLKKGALVKRGQKATRPGKPVDLKMGIKATALVDGGIVKDGQIVFTNGNNAAATEAYLIQNGIGFRKKVNGGATSFFLMTTKANQNAAVNIPPDFQPFYANHKTKGQMLLYKDSEGLLYDRNGERLAGQEKKPTKEKITEPKKQVVRKKMPEPKKQILDPRKAKQRKAIKNNTKATKKKSTKSQVVRKKNKPSGSKVRGRIQPIVKRKIVKQ